MKIYFAGSIRGGREDRELYVQIIALLKKFGEVLTEHVCDPNISQLGEDLSSTEIYKRDMEWLGESDWVVAEVTSPSLGVGYELGKAEEMGKRILCLYRSLPEKKLSAMVVGNPKLRVHTYSNIDELKNILEKEFTSPNLT